MIIPSDEDLIIGARAIIRGKVVSISSGPDDNQTEIYTYVTLRVEEVLKGEVTARNVVIKEPGGESGGRGQVVYGSPQFNAGEDVFLYLDTWPDGSLRVHQMCLGKFSIVQEQKTARSIVVRSRLWDAAEVVGKSSTGAITDEMESQAYAEMVRAKLAANLERARRFEAIHYGATPMLTYPPEYTAKATSQNIEPQFATFNPASCWFEAASGQPVVFLTNPDGAPYPDVADDIGAALNAWSTAPGVSLRLVGGVSTGQCLSVAGRNVITFNNCDGRWSPGPNCSGVLAQTSSWYVTSPSRVVNGRIFYKMTHANVSLNPYAGCYLSSRCNIQEVVTHEIGHALGLAHAGDIANGYPTQTEMDATMYPVIHFDSRCASLRGDDVAGVNFIYPAAGRAEGPAITTGAPLTGSVLGSSYLQTLGATGGAAPYTWSLAEGGGELPPGITLNSNGRLAGKVSAAGKFNFVVRVTDATSRAAQKALSITVTDGPRIRRVKYKAGKMQLIVRGERFEPSAALLVDKKLAGVSDDDSNVFTIKPLDLTTGTHEIRVVNSKGVASDPFFLKVD
ncbi:MAG TPA: putative Ig domain-containing protein [Blastocatellia bacterium]|nr:putative Ig domain-containing protein [Blastocatellia bacterium]